MNKMNQKTVSKFAFSGPVYMYFLVILRVVIGWHFLYEGVVKLSDPNWSSAGFLVESSWIFSGVFHRMATDPGILQVVDFLNTWGLILIGMGLFLGLFTRLSSIAGIVLLGIYYIANPPFISTGSAIAVEGHYLFVDKNLVELVALLVLTFFPTGKFLGLDHFIPQIRKRRSVMGPEEDGEKPLIQDVAPASSGRRELLKHLATLPVLGAFAYAYIKKRKWESFEEKRLMDYDTARPDATTGSTIKTFHFAGLKELKGTLPQGQIKDLKISRMILGGNLIGGWAHARDLIYVSKLVKAYHTDQKVFETFRLAETCGINTILTNPQLCRVINEYWNKEGGKIQFISDCAVNNNAMEGIMISIDGGAHACYVQGGIADQLVLDGKVDEIGKALDFIKQNNLPGGIGAHALQTIQECVRIGLKPDFWVKTLHHKQYWSAKPEEEFDNIWCKQPEQTIAFMNELEEPWIAYKILAAGAIHPNEGFPYAFSNGADFICVGMYDFQVVEDVNIALDVLSGDLKRVRPWKA